MLPGQRLPQAPAPLGASRHSSAAAIRGRRTALRSTQFAANSQSEHPDGPRSYSVRRNRDLPRSVFDELPLIDTRDGHSLELISALKPGGASGTVNPMAKSKT